MRHLHTLRAVVQIAKLGSIRKAADQLHIVSSALTRQVLELERELGTPLFERRPRGVALTAAGEFFVRYCRNSVHGLELVRSQIEDLKGLRGGTIRVATIEAAAATLLPQAIARFRKHSPRVKFELRVMGAGQVVDTVAADDAEIGVSFNPAPNRAFRSLTEVPQALYAVMARAHPLAGHASLSMRDCAAYPVVLGDETLGGRVLIDQFLNRSSLAFEPVMTSNSVQSMMAIAKVSDAICFQIRIGVPTHGGALRAVPLMDGGLRSGKLIVGVRRDRALPVAAAIFGEALVELLTH